jgi:hypothetical protein
MFDIIDRDEPATPTVVDALADPVSAAASWPA